MSLMAEIGKKGLAVYVGIFISHPKLSIQFSSPENIEISLRKIPVGHTNHYIKSRKMCIKWA